MALQARHKPSIRHYAYEDYFNEEGLSVLKQEFGCIDVNNSGTITVQEMKNFLGSAFSIDDVKEVFSQADNEGGEGGTGTITFHEYAEWARKYVRLLPNGRPSA